ncbi:hypothetical protein A4A49_51887 [Nicotiana attenuata]|uniref:Uncharacterized protein n=1 Tax=Nicotiana attenuata TaxID=49451 RepID=A0A1J6KIA0_NICAT|nr:hypothetical protein A4A49_51887 [Nicotiana attenuata]
MDYAPVVVNDICYAYEDESLDISCVEPTPYDQFFIKIEVEFRKLPDKMKIMPIAMQLLIVAQSYKNVGYNGSAVYDHEYMFYRMWLCADKIVNEPHNRNKKILPMKKNLTIPLFVLVHMNTVEFKAIPAGNKYVERLEKVKIEETKFGSECVPWKLFDELVSCEEGLSSLPGCVALLAASRCEFRI